MNFDILCEKYNLGNFIYEEKLTGGLMHKMYKVKTDIGVYAIKFLNPEIMKREDAFNNYEISEKISNLAKDNGIPVSSAKKFENNLILRYENNYLMIFDFIDGKTLSDDEITLLNCEKIGEILGQIHNLEYDELNLDDVIKADKFTVDWFNLLEIARQKDAKYFKLLNENVNNYEVLFKNCMKIFNENNNVLAICHRDMDSKNVMWKDNEPIIIDWESAKLANPNRDLLETALNWSGFLSNNFQEEKFLSLVNGYKKFRKINNINWNGIIIGNLIGRFGWLDYNLKRSLGLKSNDIEEITLAEGEVIKVIDEINRYLEIIPIIEELITMGEING